MRANVCTKSDSEEWKNFEKHQFFLQRSELNDFSFKHWSSQMKSEEKENRSKLVSIEDDFWSDLTQQFKKKFSLLEEESGQTSLEEMQESQPQVTHSDKKKRKSRPIGLKINKKKTKKEIFVDESEEEMIEFIPKKIVNTSTFQNGGGAAIRKRKPTLDHWGFLPKKKHRRKFLLMGQTFVA